MMTRCIKNSAKMSFRIDSSPIIRDLSIGRFARIPTHPETRQTKLIAIIAVLPEINKLGSGGWQTFFTLRTKRNWNLDKMKRGGNISIDLVKHIVRRTHVCGSTVAVWNRKSNNNAFVFCAKTAKDAVNHSGWRCNTKRCTTNNLPTSSMKTHTIQLDIRHQQKKPDDQRWVEVMFRIEIKCTIENHYTMSI